MQTAGPPAGGSPLAGETKRMAVPTVRLAMQIVCKIVSSACRQRCVNRRSPGGQVSERKNEWVNGCIQDLVHTESHPAELSDQDDHLCPMLTSTGIRGRLPNSYERSSAVPSSGSHDLGILAVVTSHSRNLPEVGHVCTQSAK